MAYGFDLCKLFCFEGKQNSLVRVGMERACLGKPIVSLFEKDAEILI